MSLRLLGATDENLTESDSGVRVGQISIELQRMFTLGDALGGATGEYFDKPQEQMAGRVAWDQR